MLDGSLISYFDKPLKIKQFYQNIDVRTSAIKVKCINFYISQQMAATLI